MSDPLGAEAFGMRWEASAEGHGGSLGHSTGAGANGLSKKNWNLFPRGSITPPFKQIFLYLPILFGLAHHGSRNHGFTNPTTGASRSGTTTEDANASHAQ